MAREGCPSLQRTDLPSCPPRPRHESRNLSASSSKFCSDPEGSRSLAGDQTSSVTICATQGSQVKEQHLRRVGASHVPQAQEATVKQTKSGLRRPTFLVHTVFFLTTEASPQGTPGDWFPWWPHAVGGRNGGQAGSQREPGMRALGTSGSKEGGPWTCREPKPGRGRPMCPLPDLLWLSLSALPAERMPRTGSENTVHFWPTAASPRGAAAQRRLS